MKAVRLYGAQDLRLQDEPEPVPLPGEQLLRVSAVGICGSDLHWFAHQGIGDVQLDRPLVLGHEFAACTETGERVAVDPAAPCGCCDLCRAGHPNLCPQVRFAGHGGVDGALREQMAWVPGLTFPLPDALSDEDGVMLEPLGVALHALDLAHLRVGMAVGIVGCGPIGLLILQLARLAGAAYTLAVDVLPHRVAAAASLGASCAELVDPVSAGMAAQIPGGRPLDVVFEVAGTQPAVDLAVAAVSPGGKLILVGIPDDDRTVFPASTVRRKGLTIKWVRRMKHTYPRAIELVQSGRIEVRSLVTHRFSLDQAGQAFSTAAARKGLKVIIRVQQAG